jgi:hypothetical protein
MIGLKKLALVHGKATLLKEPSERCHSSTGTYHDHWGLGPGRQSEGRSANEHRHLGTVFWLLLRQPASGHTLHCATSQSLVLHQDGRHVDACRMHLS